MKSVSQASKLLSSVTTRVRLLRANQEVELDRKEIVPGDVIVLTSTYLLCLLFVYSMLTTRIHPGGDVFPGDCVLFLSEALTVAQASLTGELMPVEKNPRLVLPPSDFNFDIIDNINICLAGTSVATGSGRAMVISTGSQTYVASIAKDLAKKRAPNAMQVGVRRVSYILLAFMAASPFLFVATL